MPYHHYVMGRRDAAAGLTCASLVSMLGGRARAGPGHACAEPSCACLAGSSSETARPQVCRLSDIELEVEWAEVSKLKWRFLSEGKIDVAEVRSRLKGVLERVKFAVQQIAHNQGGTIEKELSVDALHQIIAFGKETFIVAGIDAEYLRFVEKELQAVAIMDL